MHPFVLNIRSYYLKSVEINFLYIESYLFLPRPVPSIALGFVFMRALNFFFSALNVISGSDVLSSLISTSLTERTQA